MNELNIYQGISPATQERFEQPRNYGPLDECNSHARITGPCGDTMEFWLQIEGGRVTRIGFTTTGCGPSRAAGSMATELAIGKPLHEAMQIGQANILAALGGLPKESEHCALLASNTLKAAVRITAIDRRPNLRRSVTSAPRASVRPSSNARRNRSKISRIAANWSDGCVRSA